MHFQQFFFWIVLVVRWERKDNNLCIIGICSKGFVTLSNATDANLLWTQSTHLHDSSLLRSPIAESSLRVAREA